MLSWYDVVVPHTGTPYLWVTPPAPYPSFLYSTRNGVTIAEVINGDYWFW